MKLALGVLAGLAAVVAVLFAVFKLTAGKPAASTVAQGTQPAAPLPPAATDKTAQRVTAISGLVGAGAELVGALRG